MSNSLDRILVINVGLNPQIITHALWALATKELWVPDQIHVFTTGKGGQRVDELLLQPLKHNKGPIVELVEKLNIHLPRKPIVLHVPEYYDKVSGKKVPIDRVTSQRERNAVIREYDQLFSQLDLWNENRANQIYCFAKGGIDEMMLVLGLNFLYEMLPGIDAWRSLSLESNPVDGIAEGTIVRSLERNLKYWFPSDIETTVEITDSNGSRKKAYRSLSISEKQLNVKLHQLDYNGVRAMSARRMSLKEGANVITSDSSWLVCVDIVNKRLEIPAKDGRQQIPIEYMSELLLFLFANVFGFRRKPIGPTSLDQACDIFNQWKQNNASYSRINPSNGKEFYSLLQETVSDFIVPHVIFEAERQRRLGPKNRQLRNGYWEFSEAESELERHFCINKSANTVSWWRQLPRYQRKEEVIAIRKISGGKSSEKRKEVPPIQGQEVDDLLREFDNAKYAASKSSEDKAETIEANIRLKIENVVNSLVGDKTVEDTKREIINAVLKIGRGNSAWTGISKTKGNMKKVNNERIREKLMISSVKGVYSWGLEPREIKLKNDQGPQITSVLKKLGEFVDPSDAELQRYKHNKINEFCDAIDEYLI